MGELFDPSWDIVAGVGDGLERKWPDACYRTVRHLENDARGVHHTTFLIEGYDLCDRIDAYAVAGDGEVLFIDTGFWEVCGTGALDDMVRQHDVPWERAHAFITHFHDDHAGNAEYLIERGCGSILHAAHGGFRESLPAFVKATGWFAEEGAVAGSDAMDAEGLARLVGDALWDNDVLPSFCATTVDDGALLELAGRTWQVMAAPGHSPDHQILIDGTGTFAFTGDHLHSFGPSIMQFERGQDLVNRYLRTLDRLSELQLQAVYPSHEDPVEGEEEIQALIDSTRAFIERSLSKREAAVVERGPGGASVFELARALSKKEPDGTAQFDSLTVREKARTLGKEMALLEALVHRGVLSYAEDGNGVVRYHAAVDRLA